MKCRKWLATISLGLSVGAIANTDMSKSFNEAREVGKLNNGNAQSILRDFQPTKEFDDFQSRPAESNHYKGIRGNPDLSSKGMQSLNTSEVGKSIRESTINNPKVEISEDSDFIQNSNNIRKNADIISGIKNSKQCVNQVLSKTSFSHHSCEKDNSVKQVCTNTAKVKWVGEKRFVQEEIDLGRVKLDNLLNFGFTAPYDGVITDYELVMHYADKGVNAGFSISGIKLNLVKSIENKSKSGFIGRFIPRYTYHHYYQNNSPIEVKQSQLIQGNMAIFAWPGVNSTDPNKIGGVISHIMNNDNYSPMHVTLKIKMNVAEDTVRPEIEWENVCLADMDNAIPVREECTQKGEIRTFQRNGKSYELHSECWQKQTEYLVSDASDNECKKYDSDPNCTAGERECILKLGNDCIRHRIKYQCSKTVKTDGYICGDKFFCSDGSCADLEQSVNSDFGHAVSQLATLAQAGKDVSLDDINLRAFSGRPMFCRKSGFGFSDCCKDSGWGHNLHLAKCNSEENALGQAKEKELTIFVGTYCDKRVLRKCVRRKSSYCVFDNKLARIIQAQGRSGQLGFGFGGAKNPDCRGLNVDELQRIDFNAMDYSDFYEDLEANKEIPDKDRLIEYMRKSITNQLQQ